MFVISAAAFNEGHLGKGQSRHISVKAADDRVEDTIVFCKAMKVDSLDAKLQL